MSGSLRPPSTPTSKELVCRDTCAKNLSPVSWQCTAVQAAMLGLPRSLEGVDGVLGLTQQKMQEGKDLIKYFSIPCKPTKTNGGRTRNCRGTRRRNGRPSETTASVTLRWSGQYGANWQPIRFKKNEQRLYVLDQQINDRGVLVDRNLSARPFPVTRPIPRRPWRRRKP